LKRKSFGRSLSNIIEELRRQEDASKSAYEDDLDAMREFEEAESERPNAPKVIVEDSQAGVTLDVDGFVPSDFEDGVESVPEMEANGALRKPWKKKGLKRQTKRVIMRPVKKQQPSVSVSQGSSDGDTNIITETQHSQAGECADVGDGQDSDFDDLSEGSELRTAPKLKSAKTESRKEPEQKKRRNANATANANFRKLKIKNKNSKAKGRGRFASRR